MAKVVFEGTEEQIENLKILVENENTGNVLPKLRTNFQTDNLWSIEDVMFNYECTEEVAHEILADALSNEATIDQIWFALHFHAQEMGLEKKEEKQYKPRL